MDNETNQERMLSTQEVADLTGLSPATLATWRCRKVASLPFTKYSRRAVRYKLGDVREFMRSKIVNHGQVAA